MTPTQQTIARSLGVSVATVSRALRNDTRISPETKRLVQQEAADLGYKPNPMVSALMERVRYARNLHYHGKIAVVSDSPLGSKWHVDNPTFHILYDAAQERAKQFGYELEDFCSLDYDPDGRRLSDILTARGITGVFVSPGVRPRTVKLDWERFSLITSGYSLEEPEMTRVCFSNYSACLKACAILTERGYKRIGLYLGQSHDQNTEHRYIASFLVFQRLQSPKHALPLFVAPRYDKPSFLRWLDSTRPDAVLSVTPVVIGWMRDAGLKCPEDVAYVDVDWNPDKQGIAGMNHNLDLMGAAVVDILIAQLNRNERGIPEHPRRTLISGTWTEGWTIRAPAAAVSPGASVPC